MKSRKDRLRIDNHDLKQKQLQLQTDNEELEQRHEDLQYTNSKLENVNDQLSADNHTLEQRNDSLKSDNQALRQKYNDLQQNNVQLEKQQNELKSHIEQMVQDYIIRRLQCRDVVVQGNPRVFKALRNQMEDIYEELKRLECCSEANDELFYTIQLIAETMNRLQQDKED